MASKKDIVDSLSQCGSLSYGKMIEFINSVLFGDSIDTENLAPQSGSELFEEVEIEEE